MYRTLLIGVAGRGAGWARMLQSHPQFELAGLTDINAEALRQAGERFAVPESRQHLDYREALRGDAYDVAVISVPHRFHYGLTKDALLAGLHCLTEKPFVLTMPEAEELVALAAERRLVLEVAQNYRFTSSSRFLETALREQCVGRLSNVTGAFHRCRPPRRPDEAEMPWPLLYTQGIHHLDWLLQILPAAVVDVQAAHHRPAWSLWKHPAVCHLMLRCADGVLVSYQASYEAQGDISSYGGNWRFECERGDLLMDKEGRVWEVREAEKKRQAIFVPNEADVPGEHCLLDALHVAIAGGGEPPTSGRNNLRTLDLLFRVLGSGGRS